MKKYTLRELQQKETINQGHFSNLKIETENTRVWLSRMTKEDGAKANNMVEVEKLINGKWELVEEYPAEILYHNGATEKTANMIIRRVKNQTGLGYREEEILSNLAEVEQNNNVPEGYLQYIFYDVEGNGFQAGKDIYGNWGITL